MNSCKFLGRWSFVFAFLLAAFCFSGCKTTPDFADSQAANASVGGADGAIRADAGSSTELIHVGDSLVIIFSDLPITSNPFEVRVSDDGSITLILNQKFVAAGKTRAQLENEIRERYVPKYYVRMTVTIKPQERMYYVAGEIRSPGPKLYMGPMTVLKAIASAGDFTDFAKKTKVTLIRFNGKKEIINCIKAQGNPELDVPVYPGDSIRVPRRFL